ncbi:MAG: ADP-ribosylglycohydrolase family protein [Halanaerobiales bacterium]
MENKFKGALLGLIVGDALGARYEGMSGDNINFKGKMKGGGPHNISAGQWTDDTSLALCLAESLIKDGFDLESQLARYAKWFKDGYLSSKDRAFGIGRNTSISITDYIQNEILPPAREDAAGNGSIMRLAPVPMYFINSYKKTVHYSGKSSLATHNNPMAVDSCKYLGSFIFYSIHNKDKNFLINESYKGLELDNRVLKTLNISYDKLAEDEINPDGFVLNTLKASLWSFYNSDSFETAMIKAVNLGGDTDTIAAVTGQMAGSYYGSIEILEKWINKLAKKELIMSMIRGLKQSGNY